MISRRGLLVGSLAAIAANAVAPLASALAPIPAEALLRNAARWRVPVAMRWSGVGADGVRYLFEIPLAKIEEGTFGETFSTEIRGMASRGPIEDLEVELVEEPL